MIKKLELSYDHFALLSTYCRKAGITFLSTPFDLDSIEFLNTLDMLFWKIPSGEITNLPYLIKIGKTQKPVVLSTGMSTLLEIEQAIDVLKKEGCKDIRLLHCNTAYPTPYKDVNLSAMNTMQIKFACPVGYSDHTLGIEVAIAAVAMGATIIEKHFTLDRNMEGPDHRASMTPKELAQMIVSIRNIETAIGNGEKILTLSEMANRNIARKSIVAKKDISKGEVFTEDNICVKRPGTGISPMKWFEVMGKIADKDFIKDELIEVLFG